MHYSDIDFIEGIKRNDEKIMEALYHQYFRMVRHYVMTNNGNEFDAKDIYHETLMILFNAIQKEKFVLTSSLSTLIFGIGKRLWLKQLNKNKNTVHSEDLYNKNFSAEKDDTEALMKAYQDKEEQILKIHQSLQAIGHPCYEILKEFYYNKMNMEQIAEKLGYHNADVAKNQKYKCLQRLKRYFFDTDNNNISQLKHSNYES